MYLLQETMSKAFTLIKIADGKQAWKQNLDSGATRVIVAADGLVLWGKTIEQRAADTGELVWTSSSSAIMSMSRLTQPASTRPR